MQIDQQDNIKGSFFTHTLEFPNQITQPIDQNLIINNIDYQNNQKPPIPQQRKSSNGFKKKKGRRKKIQKEQKPKLKPQKQPIQRQPLQTESFDQNSRKILQQGTDQTGRRMISRTNILPENPEQNAIEKLYSQLQKNYMKRPNSQHFQTIRSLLQMKQLKVIELLNDEGRRGRKSDQSLISYLNLIKQVNRNGDEIAVLVSHFDKYEMLYFGINNQNGRRVSTQENINLRLLQYKGSIELNAQQFQFLKRRQFFHIQLQKQLKQYKKQIKQQPIQMNQISKELLFLNTISKLKQRQIFPLLQNIQQKMQIQTETKQQQINIQKTIDGYISAILFKNIKKGLQDFQFAILNYFKLFASIEANKQFIPIQNVRQLIQYIKKKKVKKAKKTKFPLATSCLGCFSNLCQQANPFKSCYQCGSRFHRYCQEASQQMCGICQGKKLKRNGVKQCQICPKKGLLYRTSPQGNIHIFCMLAYNFYEVKDKKIIPRLSIQKSQQKCNLCGLLYGQSLKCNCSGCGKCGKQCLFNVHALCAYLSGYHLELKSRGKIQFECCRYDIATRNRNIFKRKYVSNYERYAYKYYSQQEYLRQQHMGDTIDQQDKEQKEDDFQEPFLESD